MFLQVAPYTFRWDVLIPYVPAFAWGLLITFEVSIAAEVVGILLGLIAALARLARWPALRVIAIAYIDFFRGVPLLATLVWLYYGVSLLFGISFSAFSAGVAGLGITYGAYLAEIFRAGIQAIPKGQTEASRTLGLTSRQIMQYVILPQALRITLPPIGNTFVSMLKDSSLIAVLAVTDLMRQGMIVASDTFRAFEAYTFVAIIYYLVTVIVARGLAFIERRYAVSR
ncbi:MAG: amino acid ABC transporter permease [Candidatus Rokubacteria bacterium]|nr:amino acid ABC transporter permease [Candidatus Rokubacteria bacterium]